MLPWKSTLEKVGAPCCPPGGAGRKKHEEDGEEERRLWPEHAATLQKTTRDGVFPPSSSQHPATSSRARLSLPRSFLQTCLRSRPVEEELHPVCPSSSSAAPCSRVTAGLGFSPRLTANGAAGRPPDPPASACVHAHSCAHCGVFALCIRSCVCVCVYGGMGG